MSFGVKLMIIAAFTSIANVVESTTVRNGAYHNIVIEIQKDVPASDCSNFLLSLEVIFRLKIFS